MSSFEKSLIREQPDEVLVYKGLPQGANLPLKRSQVYDKIGYAQPTEDDEIF